MGLKKTIAITILMILCVATFSFGNWQGPAEIFSAGWGTGGTSFGIEYGDTSDRFPSLAAILFDGRIVISDEVNEREVLYKSDGTLLKIVPWDINQNGTKTMNPEYPTYQYWNVQGYTPEGNVWIKISGNYALKSPTGQLIKTSATKPLELGIVKSNPLENNNYKYTITYPDIVYGLNLTIPYKKFIRDISGKINAVGAKSVRKFSACGKELGVVSIPDNERRIIRSEGGGFEEQSEVIAEYGEPVIAPNGDVYTWKRTPDKYSILKWTWVDDPNVPTGPEPPTNLTLTPSINSLYLTWKASSNDPGCVTKYEIARVTTSGGVFSTIDTVEKGVLKYNDTTASAGTTYYYKIRAVAGTEYSPYTKDVSGKR